MHPQLTELDTELEEASTRLGHLVSITSEAEWSQRPPSGGWSPSECVAHLVMTSRAAIPPLEAAIAEAKKRGGTPRTRMKKDLIGWLLWLAMRPGKGPRVKTTAAFVPDANQDRTRLVNEFDELQAELQKLLDEADGLPIDQVKMTSGFNDRIRYSIYSGFAITATHEHRHLLQAERAVAANRGKAAA